MRQFLMTLFMMAMIPYVSTLAFSGRRGVPEGLGFDQERDGPADKKQVIIMQNGLETSVSAEEFLIGVLAEQIPADYGTETLKAQAVLARTYIYREMDGKDSIYEEALDMDVLTRAQMEKRWGSSKFPQSYGKIKEAVEATAGLCLTYEGTFIEPFFCRASAGQTRSRGEEYPYLKQVESPGDMEADSFLQVTSWMPESFARQVNQIPDSAPVAAAGLFEEIQIVERDGAGYVRQIQVGQKTYTGEEIQYALGLPSACYSFESQEGRIRVTCKGIGHGYGFSQAGANALEREGYDFRALLGYYFQNVEIVDAASLPSQAAAINGVYTFGVTNNAADAPL
ncbi:MAG: SpoIID/LytB domain-containing protein [Lachnospiraceae bacterium]|jgi:stage II sporulation protein D|nr:SpoIID/LytB domain-containing protein [Lachnospiraceae bacterium]